MSDKPSYPLRGVKFIDDALYIPIFELVNFCRYYPKLTTEQLGTLLKEATETLQKDERVKDVPKLVTETE